MANQNIKDETIQWIVFGLLFFCLLSFAVIFVANNNTSAFGDSASKFDASGLQTELQSIESETNILANISAQNNPEVSDLGSKDSVATAYKAKGTSIGFIQSAQMFMGWIFTGTAGKILIGVFVAIAGISAWYFGIKNVRTGT